MATLQARIEAYIGSVTETSVMNSSLQEGVNNLVQLLPTEKALQYSTEKTETAGNGVSISGRLVDVRIEDRPSRQVSVSIGKQIITSGTNNSIYKSSAVFPVHWVYGGKAYGHPVSSNIYAYVLESPTVLPTDNIVSNMPQGTDELIIFYSLKNILLARINNLASPTIGSFPAAPSVPSVQSIAYTDAAASLVDAETIGDLPAYTDYIKATVSLPLPVTLGALSLPSLPDIGTDLVLSSFSFSDITGATISTTTIGTIPTITAFSKPSISIPTLATIEALSLPNAPDPTEVTVPNISNPTLAGTSQDPVTITALSEFTFTDYSAPTFTAPTAPTEDGQSPDVVDVQIPDAPQAPSAPDPIIAYSGPTPITTTAVSIDDIPEAPAFSTPEEIAELLGTADGTVGTTADINDVTKWISAIGKQIEQQEDPELASQMLARAQTYLQAIDRSIQANVTQYNANVEKFRQDCEKVLQQAQVTLQANLETARQSNNIILQNAIQTAQVKLTNYQAELSKYNTEVNKYQLVINSEIEKWRTNVLERHLNWYINQYQVKLQKYAQDIQSNQVSFESSYREFKENADRAYEQARITLQERLAKLQGDNSVNIAEARNELEAQIAQLNSEQQRMNVLVGQYVAEVESSIKLWETNQWNSKFIKWQTEYTLSIQKYNADIQNEQAKHTADIQQFQLDSQKILEQARIATQEAISQAQQDNDINKINETQQLAADIRSWEAKIERYNTQLKEYELSTTQAIQNWELTEYRGKFEKWSAEYNLQLQKFQTDIQNNLNEFQSALPEYQANLQKIYTQLELDRQKSMQDAQLATNVDLQNKAQQMASDIAQYQADLQRYQSQIQDYSSQLQEIISKFQADDKSYQNNLAQLMAESKEYEALYTQKLQFLIASNDGAELNRASS